MADTNPIVKTKLASLRFPLTMIADLRREGKLLGVGWQVLAKVYLTKCIEEAKLHRAKLRAMHVKKKPGKIENRGG